MPIAVTLDLHANVTRAMCDLADIIVSYRTYPHVDMRRTGRQAGDLLDRTLRGEIRPRTVRAWLPMLDEVNGGRTDVGAMLPRLERARAYEAAHPDVFAVSINAGFARADIAEIGPTVLVTAQGDLAPHQRFADALADDLWEQRHDCINRFLSVEEAAAQGLMEPVLIGPAARIRQAARDNDTDISAWEVVDVPHSHAAAAKAVELAARGAVDALMKGALHSDELLEAVVASQGGLRTERRISHAYAWA